MILNEMRYPMGNHPRLAAPGAREQQKRTCNVRNRFFLLGIQSLEEIHYDQSTNLTLPRSFVSRVT